MCNIRSLTAYCNEKIPFFASSRVSILPKAWILVVGVLVELLCRIGIRLLAFT